MVNEPEKNPQIHFADKDKIPDWVKGYLNTAVNRGIIKGYDDNTFRGSNYISRAEMTAVVLRALEIKPEDQNYSRLGFADEEEIPQWSREYIHDSVKLEILKGYSDNTLRPNNYIKRSEAFCLISNAIEIKDKKSSK